MAVGQDLPTCPKGTVFAIKSHFELIAIEEARQTLKVNKKQTTAQNIQNTTSGWLEIFREKRNRCCGSALPETVVPDNMSSWLDILREKRQHAHEDNIRENQAQNPKPKQISKKELERRIITLITRCTTLNDILEQALIEEISAKTAKTDFSKMFPTQSPKRNTKKNKTHRSLTRCHH